MVEGYNGLLTATAFLPAVGALVLLLLIRGDRNIRNFATWQSHRDIAQMLQRCIDAPNNLKYDIFYATSNNRWGYRDLEHAREVLGYVPQDSAEDFN